jgi:hypothetical protein
VKSMKRVFLSIAVPFVFVGLMVSSYYFGIARITETRNDIVTRMGKMDFIPFGATQYSRDNEMLNSGVSETIFVYRLFGDNIFYGYANGKLTYVSEQSSGKTFIINSPDKLAALESKAAALLIETRKRFPQIM